MTFPTASGRIHANLLWEMGGAERVITGILERTKGIVNGITCGAGMPYRLAEIAAKFNVHYYPIVSSGRAFSALWKRAYSKVAHLLGGVVYEDPWLARRNRRICFSRKRAARGSSKSWTSAYPRAHPTSIRR